VLWSSISGLPNTRVVVGRLRSYYEGPIVAVEKLLDKQNLDWTIKGCAHAGGMDSTYVVWFGYK